jgi:type III secretion protein V
MSAVAFFASLPVRRSLRPEVVLAGGVAAIVAMLLVPLPTPVLDVLLAANIAAAILILIVSLLARSAISLSTFPTLLLITTLFRLALNVSTTRSILTTGGAGEVVRAFGAFVVRGDIIVGIVIFLLLTIVQLLVVGKGAERVAEVAARFALDAMPGKQMSIDAALRAGALSEQEAQRKRDELSRESQLFGAMDGAMKFVKGDAIAGLVIVGINLLAGFAIGVVRLGMSFGDAAEVYAILSIGDALVAQIPSLTITLAAGVLTTRVSPEDAKLDLGASIERELFGNAKGLAIGGALSILIALVPGLPAVPFLVIGAGLVGTAFQRSRRTDASASADNAFQKSLDARVRAAKAQRSLADNVAPAVVPIQIDLGHELTAALGLGRGDDAASELIASCLPRVRDALYAETGVRFPGIRVRSGAQHLGPRCFTVLIREVPVMTEELSPDEVLVFERAERLARLGIEARPSKHPLAPVPVSHAPREDAELIRAAGITVWGPAEVIAMHAGRVLRRHTKSFVGLQEASELVERLEKAYPALVREVVPKLVNLPQLVDVLRRLVDESVSIRDLKSVLEALADHAGHTNDGVALTEAVRAALSLQIAHAYAGEARRLAVVLLDPVIEDSVRTAIRPIPGGSCLALEPELCRSIILATARTLQPVLQAGARPVILTGADVRRYVRKLLEPELPEVAVLSFEELPGEVSIQPLGRVVVRDAAG